MADAGGEARQPWNPLHDARTDLRMQLDHVPLLGSEAAGFQQDTLADAELSDVA
jgi:hypothetical protein